MPGRRLTFFQGRSAGAEDDLSPTNALVDAGAIARVETRIARERGSAPPLIPALLGKILWCERMGWTLSEYDAQDAHDLAEARALLRGWDGAS